MTTNSINLNNETELSDDDEEMDVEQLGITEGAGQHQSEGPGLAGPMTLRMCTSFIILSAESATANEHINVGLDGILEILRANNTDSHDEIDELEKFAKEYFLKLCICIIKENEKQFYDLINTSVKENQYWTPCAYLVFHKHNRSFYPFYQCDENKKYSTTFPANDTHTLRVFEDLVDSYDWPKYSGTIQQLSDQGTPMLDEENASINNANRHTGNAGNQSEIILKGSGLCHLLIQQVRDLIPYVGPQLDNLNFSFQSSAYQLSNNDFKSQETTCEAFNTRLRMLLKLSDLGIESLKTNRITHTSTEITETTSIVRDTLSNNHGENILSDDRIIIEPSLPLNAASTIFENPSQLPITTNNFNNAIKLSKVKLLNQAARQRHNRTLGDLHDKKICPAVQVEGAGQGTSLQFELPEEINDPQKEFYLGAHAVTYDRKEHDQNVLVPINTSVKEGYNLKTNDLSCLIIPNDEKNRDEFNRETKGVFSKINPNELKSFHKEWTFKMFNLYQDHIVTKELIKTKKLKWCRLMFAIYIKLTNDQFERVSPPTFSDLITETYKAQSLNIDRVFPDRFCERGGQMIYVPLDQSVKKSDLLVYCNDKLLDELDYQINQTILSFETPECKQGRNDLQIIIYNYKTNGKLSFKKQYHLHDNHPEPCGVMNKD